LRTHQTKNKSIKIPFLQTQNKTNRSSNSKQINTSPDKKSNLKTQKDFKFKTKHNKNEMGIIINGMSL
jgi:hypothetical protein